MKIFTKVFSIIIVLILIVSSFVFSTSAATNSAILYFSKNTIEAGDELTVSVSLKPGVKISNVSFYLQYDAKVLNYEKGDGTLGSDGVVNVSKSASGKENVLYNFTFTGVEAGKSAISVVDCIYTTTANGANAEKKFTGASATVVVKGNKDTNDNQDALLKTLKIDGVKLSPAFSENKTSYTANVPFDTEDIVVNATPTNKQAIVEIEGADNLKVGENKVDVTVIGQDGKEKIYTISIIREDEEPKEELEENEDLEEDTKSDNSSTESTINDPIKTTGLKTVIDGKNYTIVTKIPKTALFNGFKVEKTNVNGHTIETAIDTEANYRIFYLTPFESEELLPYVYDVELDLFHQLKYITIGDNTYIFDNLPENATYPKNLYPSNITINDFEVECLADTTAEMTDFKYVYCFSNGFYNLYRYDVQEQTLQRYPDLDLESNLKTEEGDSLFSRFGSLSTNGKVIMIALLIVVLGILSLLILLIVYLIRRSITKHEDILLYSDDDFDEIKVTTDTNTDE